MKLHPNWLRTAKPHRTTETRTCEWCKRPFNHGNSRRMFCGEADCDRERDKERKREAVRLREMMQEAEQRPLSKQNMMGIKSEMRKRKGMA